MRLIQACLKARERGHRGVRVDYMGLTHSVYVTVSEGDPNNGQIRLTDDDALYRMCIAIDAFEALPLGGAS